MTLRDLISTLREQGVVLTPAEGHDLRVQAPTHVLTDDLRQRLRARKREIVELLEAEASDAPSDDGAERIRRTTPAEDFTPDPRIDAAAAAMIDEYDGRRPRHNESVHQELAAARARASAWPSGDLTISRWLCEHAPAVASRWPDAPDDASWFGWRLHVGGGDVELLDSALEAVNAARASGRSALRTSGGSRSRGGALWS